MKIVLPIVAVSALVARKALGQTETPSPYDEVGEMLLSTAETCMPGIVQSLMDLTETEDDSQNNSNNALSVLNQYFTQVAQMGDCNDDQRNSMEQAFDKFKQCTDGLDMMAYIQHMFSAFFGSALRCFMDVAAQRDVLSAETWMPGSGQILSDKCMEAMMGSNVMGDMFRTILISPDEVLPCFAAMGETAPMCAYDAWPMPVYGTWLKGAACFLGSSIPTVEKICEIELSTLNACINLDDPNVCTSAYESCSAEEPLSLFMLFPSKMFGVPLMDTCARVSQDSADLGSGLDKYNSFVQECTEVWSGWDKAISDAPEVPFDPDEPAADEPKSEPTEGSTRSGAAGRALNGPRFLGRLFEF